MFITPSNFKNFCTENNVPAGFSVERIFNIDYLHYHFEDGDDLYLTRFGVPFARNLFPENFIGDKAWFYSNAIRLSGTSSIYKVCTKKFNGKQKDVVVKWNRMGQDIPGAEDCEDLENADFNSPFEEFALVMELRDTKFESIGTLFTQKPLAIYVPVRQIDLWRSGRKEYKMISKIDVHREDIELDMFRSYAVVYEWIKGIDASHACHSRQIDDAYMTTLTLKAEKELIYKGFRVRDRKPHHIIIRPKGNGALATRRNGQPLYALVDFELLERTPERDKMIKGNSRKRYHILQKDRFKPKKSMDNFPSHLKKVRILGVDYVYGRAESTKGNLWVVGKDPDLFDFFLPERWEKKQRTRLSTTHSVYYTLSKDNINLVWKVSRVGIMSDMDPFKEDEKKIFAYGYNSPFEEVSIALELSQKGIRTVYPRAIYMFGNKTKISESITDSSRYETHKNFVTPEGKPVLNPNRTYIIIWGYWNGPDEQLAIRDGDYQQGINALRAYRERLISEELYIDLLLRTRERLALVGIEDMNLRGRHLLLSLNTNGDLIKDERDFPEVRICNFELLRRI